MGSIDSELDAHDGSARTEKHALGMSSPAGADGMTYPLGFINVSRSEASGNAVGGMLVTDNTGLPLEFMVTTAVRPTKPQRILFGDRLASHVGVELCAKQLVDHIKTKPRVIFVRDDYLLELYRHTTLPVLLLKPAESLGSQRAKPGIVAPSGKEQYERAVDLTSLHLDMIEVFDRIEKCRSVLAEKKADYAL